jgi:hypothetical protein
LAVLVTPRQRDECLGPQEPARAVVTMAVRAAVPASARRAVLGRPAVAADPEPAHHWQRRVALVEQVLAEARAPVREHHWQRRVAQVERALAEARAREHRLVHLVPPVEREPEPFRVVSEGNGQVRDRRLVLTSYRPCS